MATKDKIVNLEDLKVSHDDLDGKVSDLKSDLADLNDAFSTQCGEEIIFTSDKYIDTRGSVGSTVNTEMQISGSTKCAIFEINPGEKVFLNGTCPVVKLWAFIDAQNVLLASSPSNYTGVDLIVEAPSGTAKCIVNIRTDRPSGYCTKGIPPYYYGDMLNKLTESVVGNVYRKTQLVSDKYIDATNGSIKSATSVSYARVPVVEGEYAYVCLGTTAEPVGVVRIEYGSQFITYAWADYKQAETYYGSNVYRFPITSAEDTYICINTKIIAYNAEDSLIVANSEINAVTAGESGYSGIDNQSFVDMFARAEVGKVKDALTVNENPLKDKKITLIGDSITEYNYRAKTNWAMWLSDWTGCIVQNLGSSGTGFYRRVPYVNRISSIAQDTKIIGVAVSINDAAEVFEGHIQLGTPADVQSDGTLLGYANTFFDTLLTSFPTTPIIVYVQCPSEDYGFKVGMTNGDAFIQGVKDVCQSYNIPFYTDIYYKGSVLKPWILANRQLYFTSDNDDIGDVGVVDTIHPNSIGHKVIARRLMHRFEDNIVTT